VFVFYAYSFWFSFNTLRGIFSVVLLCFKLLWFLVIAAVFVMHKSAFVTLVGLCKSLDYISAKGIVN